MAKEKLTKFSSYINGEKQADVVYDTTKKNWGVQFSICKYFNVSQPEPFAVEWYKGHSEAYAESAAENWVMGIKESPIFK